MPTSIGYRTRNDTDTITIKPIDTIPINKKNSRHDADKRGQKSVRYWSTRKVVVTIPINDKTNRYDTDIQKIIDTTPIN